MSHTTTEIRHTAAQKATVRNLTGVHIELAKLGKVIDKIGARQYDDFSDAGQLSWIKSELSYLRQQAERFVSATTDEDQENHAAELADKLARR